MNVPRPPSPRGNTLAQPQQPKANPTASFLNFDPTPAQPVQPVQPVQTVQNPNELLFGLGTLGQQQQQAPSISKDQLLSLYAKPIAPQPVIMPTLNPSDMQNMNKPNYNIRLGANGMPAGNQMGTMGTMQMGGMQMGGMQMGTMPMGYQYDFFLLLFFVLIIHIFYSSE